MLKRSEDVLFDHLSVSVHGYLRRRGRVLVAQSLRIQYVSGRLPEGCQRQAFLEAGGDPVVIAGWMQEVQGDRLRAERDLARSAPSEPVGKAELRALVRGARDAVKMLHKADPALKAEVYAGLGLRLEYRPETRVVAVEVPLEAACATARVGGGT